MKGGPRDICAHPQLISEGHHETSTWRRYGSAKKSGVGVIRKSRSSKGCSKLCHYCLRIVPML